MKKKMYSYGVGLFTKKEQCSNNAESFSYALQDIAKPPTMIWEWQTDSPKLYIFWMPRCIFISIVFEILSSSPSALFGPLINLKGRGRGGWSPVPTLNTPTTTTNIAQLTHAITLLPPGLNLVPILAQNYCWLYSQCQNIHYQSTCCLGNPRYKKR